MSSLNAEPCSGDDGGWGNKYCKYMPDLSLREAFGKHEDFAAIEPSLVLLVRRRGGFPLLLPPFHCEINPTEHVWGSSRSPKWCVRHN